MTEILIVAADGITIKLISLCEMFQEMDFKGLKWRYAFLVGMLGNSISYYDLCVSCKKDGQGGEAEEG